MMDYFDYTLLYIERERGALGRRLMAFVLAMIMTFTSVPFPGFAEEMEQAPEESDLIVTVVDSPAETEAPIEIVQPPVEEQTAPEVIEAPQLPETTEAPVEAVEPTVTVAPVEVIEVPVIEVPVVEVPAEEEYHAPDVTEDKMHLAMWAEKWWALWPENPIPMPDLRKPDFSEYLLPAGERMLVGFDLMMEAAGIVPGDFFILRLPVEIQSIHFPEDFVFENFYVSLTPAGIYNNEQTELRVDFLAGGSGTLSLPVRFYLTAGEPIEFRLREDKDCEYTITTPTLEAPAPETTELPIPEDLPLTPEQPEVDETPADEILPDAEGTPEVTVNPDENAAPAEDVPADETAAPDESAEETPEENVTPAEDAADEEDAAPADGETNTEEAEPTEEALPAEETESDDVDQIPTEEEIAEELSGPFALAYIWDGGWQTDDVGVAMVNAADVKVPDEATKVSASGKISYAGEKVDSPVKVDYKNVIRPSVFQEPVILKVTCQDTDGHVETLDITTQTAISQNPFYFYMVQHDGNGGGAYQIDNLPNKLSIGETVYTVTDYQIYVETTNTQNVLGETNHLVAYSTPNTNHISPTVNANGLDMVFTAKMQTVTLQTQVEPHTTENPGFDIDLTFYPSDYTLLPEGVTNPDSITVKTTLKDVGLLTSPDSTGTVTLQVPAGAQYSVDLKSKDGYKENPMLDVASTVHSFLKEQGTKFETYGFADGETLAGFSRTITATTYAQNQTYDVQINWVDNQSSSRPESQESDFHLEYAVKDAFGNITEWVQMPATVGDTPGTLTAEQKTYLGIDVAPKLGMVDKDLFRYTGLPYADQNGNKIEYKVVPTKNHDGYVRDDPTTPTAGGGDGTIGSTSNPNQSTITYTKTTTFSASIEWLDGNNAEGDRPANSDLRPVLYRKTQGGVPELVSKDAEGHKIPVPVDGDGKINISDLKMFDPDNHEYDYFVVLENENDAITQNYETYYDNGSGSHAADLENCHNGGKISLRKDGVATFTANKVWADSGKPASVDRPNATLTLWRFPVETGVDSNGDLLVPTGERRSVDNAYNFANAAPVIYYDTDNIGKKTEKMLSISTNGSDTQTFNETAFLNTLHDSNAKLPQYDEQGRRYVYFVRETVDSENYTTRYLPLADSPVSAASVNGAENNEFVKNIYREKAAINVNVSWKCPTEADKLAGKTVQLTVKVPDPVTHAYKELTVYSNVPHSYDELSDKPSLSDFDANITSLDLQFFVNIYNEDGVAYDMSKAVIQEAKILVDGGSDITITYPADDNTAADVDHGAGSFTMDGLSFKAESSRVTPDTAYVTTTPDGLKQYNFKLVNTITGEVEYDVEKKWDPQLLDDITGNRVKYNQIDHILFTVQRRSLKNGATWETAKDTSGNNVTLDLQKEGTVATPDYTWDDTIANLPKYDADGYAYQYRAIESALHNVDHNSIAMEGMSQTRQDIEYSDYKVGDRTDVRGKTIMNNGKSGPDVYYSVTKIWMDNADLKNRQTVRSVAYPKTELLEFLKELRDAGTISTAGDITLNIVADALKQGSSTDKRFLEKSLDIKEGQSWFNHGSLKDANTFYGKEDYQHFDYIVLEYSVGEALVQYNAGELITELEKYEDPVQHALVYKVTGKVDSQAAGTAVARHYEVEITNEGTNGAASSGFTFTNTRVGKVKIQVEKQWQDDNNRDGLRPESVKFKLSQIGETTLKVAGAELVDPFTNTAFDLETGIITLTGEGEKPASSNTWTLILDKLPMFNDAGVPYSYSLEEITDTPPTPVTPPADDVPSAQSDDDGGGGGGDDGGAGQLGNYYSVRTGASSGNVNDEHGDPIPDYLLFTYEFTNTISVETEHRVAKIWKDAATGGKDRPDLYMKLFRYLISDQEKPVNAEKEPGGDGYDGIFEPVDLETDLEYKDGTVATNGYDREYTAKGLPQYREDGQKYGYVFREEMNNGGVTPRGVYVQTVDTETIYVPATADTPAYSYDRETFTNTLTSSMRLTSQKVWNISSAYQTAKEDLPTLQIQLYRTLDSTIGSLLNRPDETIPATDDSPAVVGINELVSNGTIKLVNTTSLDPKIADSFSFPDRSDPVASVNAAAGLLIDMGDGTYTLPKYDEHGNAYIYLMREVIDNDIAKQLFTESSIGGSLVNKFRPDVNRRKVIVEKSWKDRDADEFKNKVFPSVTYTLFRYILEDGTMKPDSAKEYKTVTVSSKIFESAMEIPNVAERTLPGYSDVTYYVQGGEVYVSFNDLLIFSPRGVRYGYYVKEKPIKGYSIQYYDADSAGSKSETPNNDFCNVNRLLTLDMSDPKDYVGTTNVYDQAESLILKGTKAWQDFNNSPIFGKDGTNGPRPDSIQLCYRRSTANEPGQNNNVGNGDFKTDTYQDVWMNLPSKTAVDPSATDPYIVWTEDTENTWSYVIYNLVKYAPNGMPYTYEVTEREVVNYSLSPGSRSINLTNATATASYDGTTPTYAFDKLTNTLNGSFVVRKNWIDGDNRYGLRPTDVTLILQRRKRDSDDWNVIEVSDADKTTFNVGYSTNRQGFSVVPYEDKNVVGVQLTDAYYVPNTVHNSWSVTFTQLPVYWNIDKTEPLTDEDKWQYRAIEVLIGTTPVALTQVDGIYKSDTSYDTTYVDETGSPADNGYAQNKLKPTSLELTKVWTVDQNDMYYSRPDHLTFTLQMRPKADAGEPEAEWQNVKNPNNSALPYTFTLTEDPVTGTWTKVLKDLPVVVEFDGEYKAVEYHAKEHTDPDASDILADAKNYTNYTTIDQYDSSAGGVFTSVVTNKLETDLDIEVRKTWFKQNTSPDVTATFELLWRVVDPARSADDDTDWHCFGAAHTPVGDTPGCIPSETGCVTHDSNVCVQCTITGNDTYTWEKLPKYDLQGRELEYKVIEFDINGYVKQEKKTPNYRQEAEATVDGVPVGARNVDLYDFTNIELQNYTVTKTWVNTDYAQKTADGKFTATFRLEYSINGGTTWTYAGDPDSVVKDYVTDPGPEQTLVSDTANDTKTFIWPKKLPKYQYKVTGTDAVTNKPIIIGNQIRYRAVETEINGVPVANDTNGSYIVTYLYDGTADPAFGGKETAATNRMVYGFVNLQKMGAYLNNGVPKSNKPLEGVTFDILDASGNPYVSGVTTDTYGNLNCNTDGTYGNGTDAKYLKAGTYKLVETETNSDYSTWADPAEPPIPAAIEFTVGPNGGTTDTGEHGTAWISTTVAGTELQGHVDYLPAIASFDDTNAGNPLPNDSCRPKNQVDVTTLPPALNVESRGTVSFTKKDGSNDLTTDSNADGEVYFGVFVGTTQVAGMKGETKGKAKMVLTNLDKDGNPLSWVPNPNGVPYLREETDAAKTLTLLTGTYTIKELVPPPGYKKVDTEETLVIPKIPDTLLKEDLRTVYKLNVGTIKGETNFGWNNNPNELTIAKLDQFGRNVTLKVGGYLELSMVGGGTFPPGVATIRLYQSADTPAKLDNSTVFDAEKKFIKYDETAKTWVITGLFDPSYYEVDAGSNPSKYYILSEPDASVPTNNTKAEDIKFYVDSAGAMHVIGSGAIVNPNDPDPMSARGDDYVNYYKSDVNGNTAVMRDVSRYLVDVELDKFIAGTTTPIKDISFKLYKYIGTDTDPVRTSANTDYWTSILDDDLYLTTDSDGKILISATPDEVMNSVTTKELKYGLDIGVYCFEEVERGASDKYLLADDVYFEIAPPDAATVTDNPSECAKITYRIGPRTDLTQEVDAGTGKLSHTGKLANTPVTSQRHLILTKVDSESATTKLAGAWFHLHYVSINNGQDGANPPKELYGITGDGTGYTIEGELYEAIVDADGNYTLKTDGEGNPLPIDISQKGTYTLVETKAPDYYMTRTEGTDPLNPNPVLLTFKVKSDNTIEYTTPYYPLVVDTPSTGTNSDGVVISLNTTIKNEKTKVYIDKLNDLVSSTKTRNQKDLHGEPLSGARLAIYEGTNKVYPSGADTFFTTNGTPHLVYPGTLKEGVTYTLREIDPPNGYMAAEDIYFKIDGTTTRNNGTVNEVVSQLYVVTADGDKTDVNIKDNTLTMVDEAIIAPVNLHKVLGTTGPLEDAVFEVKSLDSPATVLGTAVTDSNGYLVWQTVTAAGISSGLIFTKSDKLACVEADKDTLVNGKTIILRQNQDGYQFTETEASPDTAYIDPENKAFTVKITDQNYKAYKDHPAWYVDIFAANSTTEKKTGLVASSPNNLVNTPFQATFELYKYDAEHPLINADHSNYDVIGLPGAKFTLTKLWTSQGVAVNSEIDIYTTGENGLLSIPIKERGTYKLEETDAPDGYLIPTDHTVMEFTVRNEDYNKTLTYEHQTDSPNNTQTNTKELNSPSDPRYDLPNNRQHGEMKLVKVDFNVTSHQLKGVHYELKRTGPTVDSYAGSYWFPKGTETAVVVTGYTYKKISTLPDQTALESAGNKNANTPEDGTLIVKDLQWGEYEIREIVELDGYILSDKVYSFTIDKDNLIYSVTDVGKQYVTNTKNQLTIHKKNRDNPTGDDLTGATFELYKVTDDGTIKKLNDSTTDRPQFYNAASSTSTTSQEIEAGAGTIYGLPEGWYLLRETKAPKGYELAQDVLFEMKKYGKVDNASYCKVDGEKVISTDGCASITVEQTGTGANLVNSFPVLDTPIEVKLDKVLSGNVPINDRGNATFVIRCINGSSFTDGTEPKTFTTNSISVDDLKAKLIAGNEYEIEETVAPAGYEIRPKATIAVNEHGVVSITSVSSFLTVENPTSGANAGIAALTFTDIPISLTLTKLDATKTAPGNEINEAELGKAEFKITGLFTTPDGAAPVSKTVTVTSSTIDNFTGCFIGGATYHVEETKAPKGYVVADPFYIQLDEEGNIVKRGSSESNMSSVTEGENLAVKDNPSVIRFFKVEDNNTPLSGAKFELTAFDDSDNAFVNVNPSNVTNAKPGSVTATTQKIIWTSTGDPTVITNMLIAGDEANRVYYKLTELGVDDRVKNHEVMSNPIKFHLTPDGQVVIDANSSIPNNDGLNAAEVESDNVTMTIQNPIIKGKVTLTKYWKSSETAENSDAVNEHQYLPGATYTLTRTVDEHGELINEGAGSPIYAVKTTTAGGYTYTYTADSTTTGAVTKFVTDTNGQIVITGLPEGTYRFLEVDAPAAYHINNNTTADYIQFEIHNSDLATKRIPNDPEHYVETEAATYAKVMDTRINAKIDLTKFTGPGHADADKLENAVFDVYYADPNVTLNTDGTVPYGTNPIGTMTTGADGNVLLTELHYSDTPAASPGVEGKEGLRRGFYKLVERSAPDQMLNDNGYTQRNTITFKIGNQTDKTYYVKEGDAYADGTTVTYTRGGQFLTLDEHGVHDTPIPEKNITVTKVWPDDGGMDATFRPEAIYVKLMREYNDGAAQQVGELVKLTANGAYDTSDVQIGTTPWSYTWTGQDAYVNKISGSETVTYLYTYTVVEDIDPARDPWSQWYSPRTPEHNTLTTTLQTPNAEDGKTTSTLTNKLDGGDAHKFLEITKTLGGGVNTDTFHVRIKLTKDLDSDGTKDDVGNKGYYIDPVEVWVGGVKNPDLRTLHDATNYWYIIHGGETLKVKLPAGVTYEIEEETASNGDAVPVGAPDYTYIPRYVLGQTGTVASDNIPATLRNAVHKYIQIDKVEEDGTTPLSGAEYRVKYEPLNPANPVGAAGPAWTLNNLKMVDNKLVDPNNGNNPVDITAQGTYTIYETKAPSGYITPTDNSGNPIPLAVITVDANDQMSVSVPTGTAANLVTRKGTDDNGVDDNGSLAYIQVKNEKTKARIGKTIDYAAIITDADAEEGTYMSGVILQVKQGSTVKAEWVTDGSFHTVQESATPAVLSLEEGVVYTLHEVPGTHTGYANASDVYFKLQGTYTYGGQRYSRIVITDSSGNPFDTNIDGDQYGTPGVVNGVLHMVDETIIAPMDLQKVLDNANGTWTALENVEFTVYEGPTADASKKLGVAVTGTDGFLKWQSIESGAYGKNLIYSDSGKILTSGGNGSRIVLQQNLTGYTFVETYAPDHVYNDGRSFTANVTLDNYKEYRTSSKTTDLYDISKYINLGALGTGTTVASLSDRNDAANSYTALAAGLVVNKLYHSTVTLYKFDADEEAVDPKGIKDTEFTIYRFDTTLTVPDYVVYTKAKTSLTGAANSSGKFLTEPSGDLTIVIPDKGQYKLVETKAANGYKLDPANPPTFEFTLQDNATADDIAANKYGYNQSNSLTGTDGLGNERKMGEVTLTKKDAQSNSLLNGVRYTLTRPGLSNSDFLLYTTVVVDGTNTVIPDQTWLETGKNYEAIKDTDDKWKLRQTAGTDDGVLKVTGLNWGEYELTEIRELPGYVFPNTPANTYTFTVNGNADPEALTFTEEHTNTKNEVTFKKMSVEDPEAGLSTAKALAGAVFKVYEGEAGTNHDCATEHCVPAKFYTSKDAAYNPTSAPAPIVTAGADGTVTIYGLATDTESSTPKSYHLVEVTPPKGYILQTTPVNFTIARNGTVQVNSATVTEVTMEDKPIKLYIDKIGESVAEKLEGAVFTLTDACGTCANGGELANGEMEHMGITTVGTEGTVLIPIELVIAGHTYKLQETKAPDGYECTAVVTFTVGNDGTATIVTDADKTSGGYNGGGITTAKTTNGDTHIQVSNEKIRLSLLKLGYPGTVTDLEDPGATTVNLDGVVFELTTAAGSAFAAGAASLPGYQLKGGKPTITLTTVSDGTASIPLISLKHGNTYELEETDRGTHTDYRMLDNGEQKISFKVNDNGSLELTPTTLYSLSTDSNGNPQIVMKNQQIALIIKKVDQRTGEPVEGVELKLEKLNPLNPSKNKPVSLAGITQTDGTWITDATGEKVIHTVGTTLFEPGYYRLTELSVPDGHNKVEYAQKFIIQDDGAIVFYDGTSPFFEATSPLNTDGTFKPGAVELTMLNPAYTDLQITKKGSDNELLDGVQFRLEYLVGGESGTAQPVNLVGGKATVTNHVPDDLNADTSDGGTDVGTTSGGILTFGNLPDGYYRLTELATASGYSLLSTPLIVRIDRVNGIYQWKAKDGSFADLAAPAAAPTGVNLDTLCMTIINQKGLTLPATGVTTPQLPKSILVLTALFEGLVLYFYQKSPRKKRTRKP